MQKIIGLAFGLVMAMSTAGFAAGEGVVLTKLLKPAETMISIFNNNAVTYAMVSKDFAVEAKKTFTEKQFKDVKKAVADKFGKLKEYRFITFQRPDEMDIVTYLAGFTKEKVVSMAFVFNKNGKMVDFRFTPMQGQPSKKQQVQRQSDKAVDVVEEK